MRNLRTLALLLGGAAVAVVLFVVLRPDGDDDAVNAEPPPATTQEPQPPAATTEPPPPPLPPPPPRVATVRIQVRGGQVVGGIRRATVAKGRQVVLIVTADVRDHVHLHGYDLMRDVAPGAPARTAFRATVAGRFEVELEDRGLQIAELTVKP